MYTKREEALLRDVILALDLVKKNCQVYGPKHSMVTQFLEGFNEKLNNLLNLKGDISLGIIPDSLMLEDKYFERENKVFSELARFFHSRAISILAFYKGVSMSELRIFFENIIRTSGDIIKSGGFTQILSQYQVTNIKVIELDYSSIIAREAKEEEVSDKDEEKFWDSFVNNLSQGIPTEFTDDTTKMFENALDNSVQTAFNFNRYAHDNLQKQKEISRIVKRLAICAKEKFFEQDVENKKRMEEIISHLEPGLLKSLLEEDKEFKDENDKFKQVLSSTLSDGAIIRLIEAIVVKENKFSSETLMVLDEICPDEGRQFLLSNMLTKSFIDKGIFAWETALGLIESIKTLSSSNPSNKFISQLELNIEFCTQNSVDEFKASLDKLKKVARYTLSIKREDVDLNFAELIFQLLKVEEDPKELEFLTERFFDEIPTMISHGKLYLLSEFLDMFTKDYLQSKSTSTEKKEVFTRNIHKLTVPDIVNSLIKDVAKEEEEDFEATCQIILLLGKDSVRLLLDAAFKQKNLPLVINRVSKILSQMGYGIVEEIGKWLEGKDEKAFLDISPFLYKIGTDETINYLKDIYINNNDQLKQGIIKIIIEEPTQKGVGILHMGLESHNTETKNMSQECLIKLKDKTFTDILIKKLQTKNPFGSKSSEVIEVIDILKQTKAEEAIPYLAELLNKKTPFWINADNIKIAVVYTLSEIGTPEAYKVIEEAMKDKSKAVRDVCQYIINERNQNSAKNGNRK